MGRITGLGSAGVSEAGYRRPYRQVLLSRLLVDQDILLPLTGLLVSAMNAARPATGAPLAFVQLLDSPVDPLLPGLCLLGILNPTDEFIAGDGRQAFPKINSTFTRGQGAGQIGGHFVYETT